MNNVNSRIIIAVDGYSSSGKSTMARALAERLGYRYIDSGAMYRAVTLYAIRNGLTKDMARLIESLPDINIGFETDPTTGSQYTTLDGENVEKEIRGMEVSALVSQIATVPEIRYAMVKKQQEFGLTKGIVMDGRDIGTTVFPDAELKIFVDASPEKRAMRRFDELKAKGDTTSTYESVLENIRQRDYTDTHRSESPLVRAADAVTLDNSDMTFSEQNEWLDRLVESRINQIKAHK